jgi:Predicted esterase of the alpha-beta hydrolase superfamily
LQGGGAHGAFTWGVLEAVLDDPTVDVRAITATSAGAMNAACFADGYAVAGKKGPSNGLKNFGRASAPRAA